MESEQTSVQPFSYSLSLQSYLSATPKQGFNKPQLRNLLPSHHDSNIIKGNQEISANPILVFICQTHNFSRFHQFY